MIYRKVFFLFFFFNNDRIKDDYAVEKENVSKEKSAILREK